jgi:glycine cleavage system H protein
MGAERTTGALSAANPVSDSRTLFYKRSNFVTHLPVECRYSPSHFWLAQVDEKRWRVGFTKFATRMLGEIVDVQLEKSPGAAIESGEIIGSIEGFKAISDIYCVADGTFAAANSALKEKIDVVGADPYGAGWLYEFEGTPDANCTDVEAYRALLDATIDRMLAKQQTNPEQP